MPWLVCLSKPNQEAIAATNLQRQGFIFYYPKFLKKTGTKAVIRPLFPRYVFVQVEQLWRSLTGTRGISYLLMSEGGPQTISDSAIDAIRAREGDDGLFQLVKVQTERFKRGETVKAKEGPFAGLPMIYEGMSGHDRVKLLLNLLGRQSVVTIEEKLLTAA